MWSNVEEHESGWYFPCRCSRNDGISELYIACVMSRKHIFVWWRAVGNIRARVGDQQQVSALSTHSMEDNAWSTDALIRGDRHNKLTDIPETRAFDWIVAHSFVHVQKTRVHTECQIIWPTVTKHNIWNYTPLSIKGRNFFGTQL